MNLLGFIMSLVYMQAVHGWLSAYERLVNSQNFFSPYLTQEDLSRLGRNSALTGLYTNFTFPQLQRVFCFLASQHRQYAVISSWSGWRLACGFNV